MAGGLSKDRLIVDMQRVGNWIQDHHKGLWPLTCAALLLVFCFQTGTALRVESATVDETIHFTRGYLYLALGDLHFKIGHPILVNALNALPVWALTDLNLPLEDPSWHTSWSVWSDRFVWGAGNDPLSIFTLSRSVTVGLGLLTGCLVARWARELFGPLGGIVALTLYVFEPNVLAHSHLVTNDMAVTAFTLAAVYGLWRFHRNRRWPSLLLAGVALGCAQAAKYTAVVLVPLLALLALIWGIQQRRPAWRVAVQWFLVLGIAGLTIWAVYGFRVGRLQETGLPFPVPAPGFFDDLAWQARYLGKAHGAYLMGEVSTAGWWYYDLVALAVKTPLPLLLLVAAGAACAVRRRRGWPELLLPVATFVAAATTNRVDIGLRYLLPAYPFLHIYAAQTAAPLRRQGRPRLWGAVLSPAIIWLVAGTLSVAPHYLAYFNETMGGPANAPLYLVDSNLDWGQALPSLRRWMWEQDVDRVYLSYFGTAHPSAYEINFLAIPTWEPAPEKAHPFQRVFLPSNPAPGYYAISATNLFGPTMPDRETLAWFRDREPVARVAHAIYVYEVKPTGPPVNVALSGLQIDELSPQTVAQLGTNDLRLRWFDARHSLVFPAEHLTWVLVAEDTPLAPTLAAHLADKLSVLERHAARDGRAYTAYRLDTGAAACPANETAPSVWWSPATTFPPEGFERHSLAWPVDFGPVALMGYILDVPEVAHGGELRLLTCWRAREPDGRDLKIFAHLLDTLGQLVEGQDRLDVPASGWRTGDLLIQAHRLALPPELPAGAYQVEIGWYDSETGGRLSIHVGATDVADRVLLKPLVVSPR